MYCSTQMTYLSRLLRVLLELDPRVVVSGVAAPAAAAAGLAAAPRVPDPAAAHTHHLLHTPSLVLVQVVATPEGGVRVLLVLGRPPPGQ